VIRAADERFIASMAISSSTRFSFTGKQVGWMMNTSVPRTFSRIWQ